MSLLPLKNAWNASILEGLLPQSYQLAIVALLFAGLTSLSLERTEDTTENQHDDTPETSDE